MSITYRLFTLLIFSVVHYIYLISNALYLTAFGGASQTNIPIGSLLEALLIPKESH